MSFDDVLLVLIREFVVLQVDLAIPTISTSKSIQNPRNHINFDLDPPDDRNLPDVR